MKTREPIAMVCGIAYQSRRLQDEGVSVHSKHASLFGLDPNLDHDHARGSCWICGNYPGNFRQRTQAMKRQIGHDTADVGKIRLLGAVHANDSRYRLPLPKRHVLPARFEVPLYSEPAGARLRTPALRQPTGRTLLVSRVVHEIAQTKACRHP